MIYEISVFLPRVKFYDFKATFRTMGHIGT